MAKQESLKLDLVLCEKCANEIKLHEVANKFNIVMTDNTYECEYCGKEKKDE